MKYILILLAFLVAACGSATSAVHPTKAPEPTLVAMAGDFGPAQIQEVAYFQKVSTRVQEISVGINNPNITALTDWLSGCSIGDVVAEGAKVVYVGNTTCNVVVFDESDAQFENWEPVVRDTKVFASWDPEYGVIYLRRDEDLSTDFLAAVLLHEALHASQEPCLETWEPFYCKAYREAEAYTLEFVVLDFLGSQKNPSYNKILSDWAKQEGPRYEESGKISLPDYDQAMKMRNFFESHSERQDELWLSLYWLRQNYEMYRELRGDTAIISFQAFLETLYRNGNI